MSTVNIVCPTCFTRNRVPAQRLADHPVCGKCRERLFNGKPTPVNAEQFRQMLAGNDIPVVVDFWAQWCGPCKMFAPVYESAAERLEPGLRLLKVETDEVPTIAAEYHIQSIPTLAIFKGGAEVTRQAGAMPLPRFLDWIKGSGVQA